MQLAQAIREVSNDTRAFTEHPCSGHIHCVEMKVVPNEDERPVAWG